MNTDHESGIPKNVSLLLLLQAVSNVTDCPIDRMRSIYRMPDVVQARELFCWVAKKTTPSSYPRIRFALSGKFHGHSMVIDAVRRFNNKLDQDNLVGDASRTLVASLRAHLNRVSRQPFNS